MLLMLRLPGAADEIQPLGELFGLLRVLMPRQKDPDACAAARNALHHDIAAALADNAIHSGHAQAHSLAARLGRVERLEEVRAYAELHPNARIGYGEDDVFAGRKVSRLSRGSRIH